MAEQYFLYTVTGLREPFYAAVDHETGRAWTAPTKDGAIRQAREAGIDTFVEKTITREKFLRSLGIEAEPLRRIPHDSRPDDKPQQPAPKPETNGGWFVVGENAVDDDSNGKTISIPAWSKNSKKAKPAKGASPFAAGPIGGSSGEIDSDEDMLIIPSSHDAPAAPTPFTDVPPVVEEEDQPIKWPDDV